jgi:hypothetical protein
MEFAAVITGVAVGRRLGQQAFGRVAMAARLDRAEIGEEIGGPAQATERTAAPVIGRGIDSIRDVQPILLDQPPQIAQQPLPVGHLAAAQLLRQRQRLGHPRRQPFLAEEPPDPGSLRGLEGELVEGDRHHAMEV